MAPFVFCIAADESLVGDALNEFQVCIAPNESAYLGTSSRCCAQAQLQQLTWMWLLWGLFLIPPMMCSNRACTVSLPDLSVEGQSARMCILATSETEASGFRFCLKVLPCKSNSHHSPRLDLHLAPVCLSNWKALLLSVPCFCSLKLLRSFTRICSCSCCKWVRKMNCQQSYTLSISRLELEERIMPTCPQQFPVYWIYWAHSSWLKHTSGYAGLLLNMCEAEDLKINHIEEQIFSVLRSFTFLPFHSVLQAVKAFNFFVWLTPQRMWLMS